MEGTPTTRTRRGTERFGASFFTRDAVTVARDLLGAELVHRAPDGIERIGRIVETEAYCGPGDRACHASRGLTPRTKTLLGPAGRAYVFLVYGMHECFNVVCGGRHQRGHAVLVRGIEAVDGIAEDVRCDGPGRAARAMGFGRVLDGHSLLTRSLHLRPGVVPSEIDVSPRVGVAYAGDHALLPYRFFVRSSRGVSRPPKSSVGLGT